MPIPFWQRPWLDGAEEHYREDVDASDLPRICLECSEEYFDDDEFLCPLCREIEALEDQLSPPIQD